MAGIHLGQELPESAERLVVETRFGPLTGGRARNGAAVFLEVPYALPPVRFQDPVALPPSYRYEAKDYIFESSYAAQPLNDGQTAGMPFEDKVGLGKPTENPLFVNIIIPPEYPSKKGFPVHVYLHGGFLQFGSPHGFSSPGQYAAAERSVIWVNIGYRLSVFGFLACDEPRVDGNFGFKDQWLALQWIKENIGPFGGNPDDIHLAGFSAGAHSVHQILHHVSRLPKGVKAAFHSAVLHSNAMLTTPKRPSELRLQFQTLCRALELDPADPSVLETLRDPVKVPAQTLTDLITAEKLGPHGTFRGTLDGAWLSDSPDPMAWQRSGDFARGLQAHGVRSIVIGNVSEEWYLYAIAHPIERAADVALNLKRYYPAETVAQLLPLYEELPEDAPADACARRFGEVLSDGQIYLPVRLLHRDLLAHGFPVFRYEIRWAPEQVRARVKGYVTHGTDRPLWAVRLPVLEEPQVQIARAWLAAVADEVLALEREGQSGHGVREMLTLEKGGKIRWAEDTQWDELMRLRHVFPGEDEIPGASG